MSGKRAAVERDQDSKSAYDRPVRRIKEAHRMIRLKQNLKMLLAHYELRSGDFRLAESPPIDVP